MITSMIEQMPLRINSAATIFKDNGNSTSQHPKDTSRAHQVGFILKRALTAIL